MSTKTNSLDDIPVLLVLWIGLTVAAMVAVGWALYKEDVQRDLRRQTKAAEMQKFLEFMKNQKCNQIPSFGEEKIWVCPETDLRR